jgi:hypothetical protein
MQPRHRRGPRDSSGAERGHDLGPVVARNSDCYRNDAATESAPRTRPRRDQDRPGDRRKHCLDNTLGRRSGLAPTRLGGISRRANPAACICRTCCQHSNRRPRLRRRAGRPGPALGCRCKSAAGSALQLAGSSYPEFRITAFIPTFWLSVIPTFWLSRLRPSRARFACSARNQSDLWSG